MVLILSTYLDHSSIEVTDWLLHFGKKFKRLNGYDFRDSNVPFKVVSNQKGIKIYIDDVDLDSIQSVFYRRWISYNESFKSTIDEMDFAYPNDAAIIKRHMVTEMRKSYLPLFSYLDKKQSIKCLPNFSSAVIEKTQVLSLAADIGLNTPEWLVCNTRASLLDFSNNYTSIITKPLGEIISYHENETVLKYVRTEIVDKEIILDMPESFFPSFFQEYIEKEVEIRSFFLNGKFYSMAIFSQLDDKTAIDFRNYNDEHPNRNVPFQLPLTVETKLAKLMSRLSLNTGSIDLIFDKEGDFHFLEINPVGQFGMTSKPCNYYLEKKIAEYL